MRTSLKKKSLTFAGLALVAALAWFGYFLFQDPDLVWTAINVNDKDQQADAHLLTINRRVHILIDTGHPDTADSLLKFLKEEGVRRINAVIVTHSHRDHYGGLIPLIRAGLTIDAVFFTPAPPYLVHKEPGACSQAEIEQILYALHDNRIPLTPLTGASQWVFDNGISLKVLYVFDGLRTPVGHTDIHDTSAIIMLTHHKIRILFPGDLTKTLGRYITQRRDVVPLKADVLKAPLHGADASADEAFFEAVSPKAVVVPAPKTLWLSDHCRRMRKLAARCPTYVNGFDGHVTVKSDGYTFRVETQWHGDRPDEKAAAYPAGP